MANKKSGSLFKLPDPSDSNTIGKKGKKGTSLSDKVVSENESESTLTFSQQNKEDEYCLQNGITFDKSRFIKSPGTIGLDKLTVIKKPM